MRIRTGVRILYSEPRQFQGCLFSRLAGIIDVNVENNSKNVGAMNVGLNWTLGLAGAKA